MENGGTTIRVRKREEDCDGAGVGAVNLKLVRRKAVGEGAYHAGHTRRELK